MKSRVLQSEMSSKKESKMNLRISVESESYDRFKDLASKKKLKHGDLLNVLLDNYSENSNCENITSDISLESLNLTEDESTEVKKAITNSNSSLLQVMQDGTLQRARYLNSVSKKESNLDNLTDEELRLKSFKGVANYRINQAIETVINHNNNQGEKANKICLTRSVIFKLTGSNRAIINKFFDDHHIMISDHNQKHELTDLDNRKGKNFDVKKFLGVE